MPASLDCIRYLIHQGLSFRGHDESQDSSKKGNFREFLANQNKEYQKMF